MDWVISIGILANYILLARKIRWGWITSYANNILWAVYMAYKGELGFMVCGFVLAGLAIYGWYSWRQQ
jgi:hypothetical protein